MKTNRFLFRLICLFTVLLMVFNYLCVSAEARVRIGSVKKCIFIIGDSRTCGINRAIRTRLEDYEVYAAYDMNKRDAIYKMDDTVIVLCAEAGGGYENGSFDDSLSRMWKLIEKYPAIQQADEYVFYNLYGVNDIICEPASKSTYPSKYIEADKYIKTRFGAKCTKCYQFNVGPLYEEGWVSESSSLNNQKVAEFNSLFKSNEYVDVINLNGFINSLGLSDFDVAPDDSGLHYSDRLNDEIFKLIIALSQNERPVSSED